MSEEILYFSTRRITRVEHEGIVDPRFGGVT